jgi:Na+-transporting NADH:ubiquinone oxidoreductase subunit C
VRSDRYTLFFAAAVCVICSLVLSLVTSVLRPYQERNIALDKKKNILKSLNLYDPDRGATMEDIERIYNEKIQEVIIDARGNEVQGKSVQDAELDPSMNHLFLRKDNGALAIPVAGMGLWDMIKGYLAIERDGHTVMGITFYEQLETAGLGAEIVNDMFTDNFKGKDILNSAGELVAVTVAKGKAEEASGGELRNTVDGISGATMTGRGVTDLLKAGAELYKPYLQKLWK